MVDEADKAYDLAQIVLEQEIAKVRSKTLSYKDSADECVECGNLIPSERQLAVPGVQLCIECAKYAERKFAEFGMTR
jgi:phage/conjugal plasmid C-4 type zinc finger TraR family protein